VHLLASARAPDIYISNRYISGPERELVANINGSRSLTRVVVM
jgi:hypothetical protein